MNTQNSQHCPHCGATLPAQVRYCHVCGKRVEHHRSPWAYLIVLVLLIGGLGTVYYLSHWHEIRQEQNRLTELKRMQALATEVQRREIQKSDSLKRIQQLRHLNYQPQLHFITKLYRRSILRNEGPDERSLTRSLAPQLAAELRQQYRLTMQAIVDPEFTGEAQSPLFKRYRIAYWEFADAPTLYHLKRVEALGDDYYQVYFFVEGSERVITGPVLHLIKDAQGQFQIAGITSPFSRPRGY